MRGLAEDLVERQFENQHMPVEAGIPTALILGTPMT
jgi:hypothetical protein